jgi:acylphosphatase
MIRLSSIVTGQVQGVRFRDYVQVSAVELGLLGFVRNLPDGSVEVVAEGNPDTLKELVEYLNEGSLMSKVESVSVDWGTASATFIEFSVLM